MENKPLRIFLSFLNLVGFLGVIVVNALANILPINNKTTGELSDLYPNLFVPAGLTFSIWGIIYILLGVFIIYQIVISIKGSNGQFVEKISIFFFASSVLNIGWIFAWHYEVVILSLAIMLLLAASLIIIYLRLNIGKSKAANIEKFLVHIPFSVYLGWITIATIANVTAVLVDIGWNGFGLSQQFWTVLVIAVGIIIAFATLFIRNDIYYCLVVDWALLGILLKRLNANIMVQSVIIASIVGLVLITIGIIIQIIRKKALY
ncbi:MAG: hypothetical protein ACQEP2_05795 [Actinomycetota bacterium]